MMVAVASLPLISNGCWRIYGCSSCSARKSYIRRIGRPPASALHGLFPFGFFVVFYRILYADFMVVPFAFFSDGCHVKFLINGRYRDIKSINLLCIPSLYVTVSVVGSMKLCSVFLCILGSSRKQI